MIRTKCIVALGMLLLAASVCKAAQPGALNHLRSWTPEDSVRLNEYTVHETNMFGTLAELDWSPQMPGEANTFWSSDRGKFEFILSRSGDAATDQTTYTLQVWDRRSIEADLGRGRSHSPSMLQLARISRSSKAAIRTVQFDDESRTIFFVGTDDADVANVFSYSLDDRKLQQLTHFEQDVQNYRKINGVLIVQVSGKASEPPALQYPFTIVAREESETATPRVSHVDPRLALQGSAHARPLLFAVTSALQHPRRLPEARLRSIGVSPDGSSISLTRAVEPKDYRLTTVRLQDGNARDLILTTPDAFTAWRPDQRSILTFERAPGPRRIVLLDLTTNRPMLVATLASKGSSIQRAIWRTNDAFDALVTSSNGRASWYTGRYKDDVWTFAPVRTQNQLGISLDQDMNRAPVLRARKGMRSIDLTGPDPLMSRVSLTLRQRFVWRDHEGQTREGALLLPSGYVPGSSRIPVIIQSYHYSPGIFRPDGDLPWTANSAQTLAARGFAVLELGTLQDWWSLGRQSGEFEYGDAYIQSAIAELDRRRIVNPDRIGTIGFSRSGSHIYYAITHPARYKYAAAVADDSSKVDLYNYFKTASADGAYGGNLWTDRVNWFNLMPSLNVDRVRTPILFADRDFDDAGARPNTYPPDVFQITGPFDLNDKPLEYLLIPGRTGHYMLRPGAAAALQHTVVDWMSFWLKGEMPSNPTLKDRWLLLRRQQERVLFKLSDTSATVPRLPEIKANQQARNVSAGALRP